MRAATTQEYPGSGRALGTARPVLFASSAAGSPRPPVGAVVMAQHDVRHGREVDAELACYLEHRRAVPRVSNKSGARRPHQGATPTRPRPGPRACREDRDVEGLDLNSRWGTLATSEPGCAQVPSRWDRFAVSQSLHPKVRASERRGRGGGTRTRSVRCSSIAAGASAFPEQTCCATPRRSVPQPRSTAANAADVSSPVAWA